MIKIYLIQIIHKMQYKTKRKCPFILSSPNLKQ